MADEHNLEEAHYEDRLAEASDSINEANSISTLLELRVAKPEFASEADWDFLLAEKFSELTGVDNQLAWASTVLIGTGQPVLAPGFLQERALLLCLNDEDCEHIWHTLNYLHGEDNMVDIDPSASDQEINRIAAERNVIVYVTEEFARNPGEVQLDNCSWQKVN